MRTTRQTQFLVAGAFFLAIALVIGAMFFYSQTDAPTSRAPQSNDDSQATIMNQIYDATSGTLNVVGLTRGVLSPQSNNLSPAQIWNYVYDPTCGCLQIAIDESSADIPFTNLSSLTAGDVLYYDSTGTEWLNTQGQLTVSGVGTSPALTLKNPTAEDTSGGRESTIAVKGVQSGAEVTTLGKIEFSHYGTSDDEKGNLRFYLNDGNDANSPSFTLGINATGVMTDRFPTASDTNTILGISAGSAAMTHTTGSTGWYNTVFGGNSMTALTGGAQNTSVGYNNMLALTTGTANTAVGYSALGASTTNASNNVGIGLSAALRANQTNVAIGNYALFSSTGSSNVAIGHGACQGPSANSASNNICIGYNAADSITTGGSNIIIGYDVDLPAPTTSNWINIGNVFKADVSTGAITLPAYTRSMTIPANAAVLGPTAPTLTTIGTYRGLAFDADAETVSMTFEVPDDWNGASNMTFKIYWTNEPGTAISDTQTVKWDYTYRVTADMEDLDAGTAGTGTATYTQSGAGVDGNLHETEITITYNDANQPLVANHVVGILFDRDFTGDSYASDAVVLQWEIDYTSVSIPKHD